jgi:hypothetical protein
MGNPFGRPLDPDQQRTILRSALELATSEMTSGQIVDLPDIWPVDFTEKVSASLLAMT